MWRDVDYGTTPGEVDRYNMQRVISFTANIHGKPLGAVVAEIRRGDRSRRCAAAWRERQHARPGARVRRDAVRTCAPACCSSVVVIFLLLAANFQSFRLALAVISASAGGDLRRAR